jgi:flagellar biosynthetic protein FliR
MRAELTFQAGTLYSFLLVLARVGGALVFVPLPGIKSAPEQVRAALALGFTLALFSRWPFVDASTVTLGTLTAWAVSEAALGVAVGLTVAIAFEAFTFAAQALGLQAGYAYASTVDPTTQADSGVLLVFAQLASGLLFFALGLDREFLRLFALSLERIPLGAYVPAPETADSVIHLASSIFTVGLRLAFPVIALMILVDVALALMGRINSQLQLLSLAFPAKMLAALLVFGWTAVWFPRILHEYAGQACTLARRLMGL